jgi:hypothetical protein
MIISFFFTIKIINSIDNLERYQTMISKAVNCAKEHHKVNFYTDAETLPYLDIEGVDIKLIDTNGFYFVDDFKIHLLSIISDEEVLVDTDLFLFKELKLEDAKDVYVDFMDSSKQKWYTEYLNWFIDNGINELIPEFGNDIIIVPNIGILKIQNTQLKEEYREMYYKIREWVLYKDTTITKGVSIILGQYLLGLLVQKYKVGYCYSSKNHYVHLSGPSKFKSNILNNIQPNKIKKLL